MFRVRRIFWKIFFAFWLANLLIMAAATFVLLNSMESSRFKERHSTFIKELAIKIVYQYEISGGQTDTRMFREIIRRNLAHHQTMRKRPLSIYDQSGQLIFSNFKKKRKPRDLSLNYSVTSESGNIYQVFTIPAKPPRILIGAIRLLNTFQLVFILVVSTLVSLGLSWTITRPLNKLGDFSRRYANGDLRASIERPLLERGDEIGDLARDFEFMSREVEKNIQSQRRLLHDVSHELRAPLARLQTAAGILQQSLDDENTSVERIHRECEHIDNLIQHILEFSRLEQDKIVFQQLDMKILIEDLIGNIRYEFPEHQILVTFPDGDLTIKGHKEFLGWSLSNIVSNACKYSPKEAAVDIAVEISKDVMCIKIRDHGPGVQESELHNLLQPFYRAGNKMHADGYGLGLSIAKRAVELHQGLLTLQNSPHGGLLVKVELPLGGRRTR